MGTMPPLLYHIRDTMGNVISRAQLDGKVPQCWLLIPA